MPQMGQMVFPAMLGKDAHPNTGQALGQIGALLDQGFEVVIAVPYQNMLPADDEHPEPRTETLVWMLFAQRQSVSQIAIPGGMPFGKKKH